MGISAGGFLPSSLLSSSRTEKGQFKAYLGCVPGTVQRILTFIPDANDWSFLDLGCGMGRALAVASGFPFRSIIGIEINADLVRMARRNAAKVAEPYPDRTPIVVRHGDATLPSIKGPTILFMYHPFGPMLMDRLLDHIEASVQPEDDVLLIYLNPVHGDQVDARPRFRRWRAEILSHDAQDRAYTHDKDDAVIIWHVGRMRLAPCTGADRDIITVWTGKVSLQTDC